MRRCLLITAGVLALATTPGIASAAEAIAVAGITTMRSDPGDRYPIVAYLDGGARVNIGRCLPDYSWCEARARGARGWIAAARLNLFTLRTGERPQVSSRDSVRRRSLREVPIRILGRVTDRPGYCYALGSRGNSLVVRCPAGSKPDGNPRPGRGAVVLDPLPPALR